MKYNFKYKTKASDLWQITMYNIYSSFMGTVNIIFTIAMILLAVKYWSSLNLGLRFLVLIGVFLFIAIQPLLIYLKSLKHVRLLPKEIEMIIDDYGLKINNDHRSIDIKWKEIQGISKKPTLLLILAKGGHGYILTNSVLGTYKTEVYVFIRTMLQRHKK